MLPLVDLPLPRSCALLGHVQACRIRLMTDFHDLQRPVQLEGFAMTPALPPLPPRPPLPQ